MPGITLINSFEVPPGREDEFFELWKRVNDYMQTKPGYISHKLHRALTLDARFRFVNVAQWASLAEFEAAHDAGFRQLAADPAWSAFPPPYPVLYEVVHQGPASAGSGGS